MNDFSAYQAKRETLRQKHISKENVTSEPANGAGTGGVDHLAMISSDIEQTIEFYTGVLGMTVTDIIQNRNEPRQRISFSTWAAAIPWPFSISQNMETHRLYAESARCITWP